MNRLFRNTIRRNIGLHRLVVFDAIDFDLRVNLIVDDDNAVTIELLKHSKDAVPVAVILSGNRLVSVLHWRFLEWAPTLF